MRIYIKNRYRRILDVEGRPEHILSHLHNDTPHSPRKSTETLLGHTAAHAMPFRRIRAPYGPIRIDFEEQSKYVHLHQ
jgi:hypothetical protein